MNTINNPKHILKLINNAGIKVGLDIGGSLTKLSVALHKESGSFELRKKFKSEFDFIDEIELNENYLFIKNFQTAKFKTDTIEFLKRLKTVHDFNKIYATGGGAFKFYDLILEEFKITMEKHDELLSLVKGYLMMSDYKTFYELTGSNGKYSIIPSEDIEFPHIAVNVGSGVSVLQVNSINDIKRVTGTLMGGGTLIGLSKLLINVDNYNDIMKLAKQGDNTNVDLLVKDIYGPKSQGNISLEGDTIASSFGKIHHFIQSNNKDKIKKEDIAKSLLVMICYHIAQLAYLVCEQNNIKKYILFNLFVEYIILVTLREEIHMRLNG